MRARLFALTLSTIAIVPYASAQVPTVDAPKLLGTSAEIQALVDANKRGNIVKVGAYRANLEMRPAGSIGNAALHPHAHEFFYIVEGTVDIHTGGTLVDPKGDPNGAQILGTKIDGGSSVRLSKGDFYIVPVNTPHQLTPVNGNVADISMFLPAGAPPP